jgi:hypothetical protein
LIYQTIALVKWFFPRDFLLRALHNSLHGCGELDKFIVFTASPWNHGCSKLAGFDLPLDFTKPDLQVYFSNDWYFSMQDAISIERGILQGTAYSRDFH